MRMTREEFVDIIENTEFFEKFANYDYAQNFYAAFCNVDWAYEVTNTEIKEVSFSWRSIANIVADFRKTFMCSDPDEDYIDFYCSGMACDADEDFLSNSIPKEYLVPEGMITDEVMADLNAVGFFAVSVDEEEKNTPITDDDMDEIQSGLWQSDDDYEE